jgi:hypothetical protein
MNSAKRVNNLNHLQKHPEALNQNKKPGSVSFETRLFKLLPIFFSKKLILKGKIKNDGH